MNVEIKLERIADAQNYDKYTLEVSDNVVYVRNEHDELVGMSAISDVIQNAKE